jgi:hypothetical protein
MDKGASETSHTGRNQVQEVNRYEQIAKKSLNSSAVHTESKNVHGGLIDRYDRQFNNTGRDLSADRRKEQSDPIVNQESTAVVQALKEATLMNTQQAKEIDLLTTQLTGLKNQLADAGEVKWLLSIGLEKT